MKTFADLGISESLIKGLTELKILTPTEIQEKTIPFLLEKGSDFIGQAQTGTGKTAAFGLPLLMKVNPKKDTVQALILSPTRELGQQIAKQLFRFTKFSDKIFVEAVYGGEKIDIQIARLNRPTHIVVATPGRLIDLLERKAIDLSDVQTIVLDEADEMLSMGFKKELDMVLTHTKGKRYTWLFSATMPKEIKDIIGKYMAPDAFKVEIDKDNVVNKHIDHQFITCADPSDKLNVLLRFLKTQGTNRGVVFCKTKSNAQVLAKQLMAKNIPADAIEGDMQQRDREKVMRAFKGEKLQVLVATDLAARGIDVEGLSYVIHYQLPDQIEYYTHRSGRTARAGKYGLSLSLVMKDEMKNLRFIEKNLGISILEAK